MEWIPFWRSIFLFIFTTFFLYFLNNIIAWIVDWWIILWKNRCILIKKNAPLKSISTYCTYRRPSGAESKKPLQFGYLSQAKKNILTTFLKRKVRSSKKPCNFSFSISRWRSKEGLWRQLTYVFTILLSKPLFNFVQFHVVKKVVQTLALLTSK